jgi:ABC-type polar amino acid transport system ATPase subunit
LLIGLGNLDCFFGRFLMVLRKIRHFLTDFSNLFFALVEIFVQRTTKIGAVFTTFKLFPELQVEVNINITKIRLSSNKACKVGNLLLGK